jgi:mono/diheme cytochrome c family protein
MGTQGSSLLSAPGARISEADHPDAIADGKMGLLQAMDVSGGKLFRLNCAGCHGLAAQGLVGPNLHGVDHRKNDRQLIQQVISGRTPPMPRFQPDPQDMADLLAFLHLLA